MRIDGQSNQGWGRAFAFAVAVAVAFARLLECVFALRVIGKVVVADGLTLACIG